MKKFLLSIFVLSIASTAIADSGALSSEYLENLKNCTPYKETKRTNLSVGDTTAQGFSLITKEAVVGWKNGRCITLSKAYSPDLDQTILASRCEFSQEQLKSIVAKINLADRGDKQALQSLKEELQQYIQDGYTCKVKTFLGDD